MEDQDQKLAADKAWQEHVKRKQTKMDEEKRRDDRMWLSGMAMQGLIAQGGSDVWRMAHQSWQMADAMLEVEERSGQAQG